MPRERLPTEEVARLTKLRATSPRSELRTRVQALRQAGWSLAAIAQALDTYRSTVRSWSLTPTPSPALATTTSTLSDVPMPTVLPSPPEDPSPPLFSFPPGMPSPVPRLTVVPLSPRLSPQDVGEIRKLAAPARLVRGHTPRGHPHRMAAARLNYVLTLHRTRGVPVPDLARAARLSDRALRTRLPHPLPPWPQLLDSEIYPGIYLLVVWPTQSDSRRWRTYVDKDTHYPVAFPVEMLTLPKTTWRYHALSLRDAEYQLGWPQKFVLPLALGVSHA